MKAQKTDPYSQETIQALLSPACITAPYPLALGKVDEEIEATFQQMNELVRQVRNIRAEMALPPSEKTELIILGTPHDWEMAKEHQNILAALTPTAKISFTEKEPAAFGASALVGKLKLMIPIPESMKAKEKARLEKENEKLSKLLESTQGKLANEEFRSRAPREVVEKLELALAQTEKQLLDIAQKLKSFS